MMIDQPSSFVMPGIPGQTEPSTFLQNGLYGVGVLLVLLAIAWVLQHRSRRLDPRELAFRTIVQKLGYSRHQIRDLRQTAAKSGMSSPVGLVMSPSMSARVTGSRDTFELGDR